ncbi:MAG: Poly-beta-1,6-N-acetyl-D-glucosamine synthase [candidate division WS2 bacterium]|nr:Poly-beta-1,6-N-acetyl-D-glucosamine synthase [Candidatus Psychracetigena formicireducens]
MISIVIPTKNNGDILERCLSSIEELDYPEDVVETIIVDGHSTDNTIEIAKKFGCMIVWEDVGTRGGACNVGVRNAKGEFIVFTDADCVVPKDWLKNLIKHFNSEDVACVGGPNITPEDDTEFAKCVGTVLSFLSKPGSRYGLNVDRVFETFHNPGCNVAYRKNAIEEAGWFNEKLITCEDEELDYRILKKGYRILYTPDAKVYHYRRPTWKRFYKQAYKYAVGRMQGIKLHWKMGRWYHYAPPALISLIAILFALSPINFWYFWGALSILVIGGIGIGIMSLYLGAKTKMRNFLTYCVLIAIWFWGSGFGYFRGLRK